MDSAGDAAPDRGGIVDCTRAIEGRTIGGRILCFLEGGTACLGIPAMRLSSEGKEESSVYLRAEFAIR